MSYQSPTDINKQTYLSYTHHNLSAAAGLRQNAFPEFAQSDRPPPLLNCFWVVMYQYLALGE